MPKKTNKTDHVLNLIAKGGNKKSGEAKAEPEKEPLAAQPAPPAPSVVIVDSPKNASNPLAATIKESLAREAEQLFQDVEQTVLEKEPASQKAEDKKSIEEGGDLVNALPKASIDADMSKKLTATLDDALKSSLAEEEKTAETAGSKVSEAAVIGGETAVSGETAAAEPEETTIPASSEEASGPVSSPDGHAPAEPVSAGPVSSQPAAEQPAVQASPSAGSVNAEAPAGLENAASPIPTVTETASPAPTVMETASPAPTPTAMDAVSPTPTAMETASPAPTAMDAVSPAPTAMETASPTPAPTAMDAVSPMPTAMETALPTPAPTAMDAVSSAPTAPETAAPAPAPAPAAMETTTQPPKEATAPAEPVPSASSEPLQTETAPSASPEPLQTETAPSASPEPLQTEAAPSASPEPLQGDAAPEPVRDYEFVNVMEHAVDDKVDDFMERFDLCHCDRCRADVSALALSHLQPKYIVAESHTVAPLLSFYKSKFNSEIVMELTKACFAVKDNPRH